MVFLKALFPRPPQRNSDPLSVGRVLESAYLANTHGDSGTNIVRITFYFLFLLVQVKNLILTKIDVKASTII